MEEFSITQAYTLVLEKLHLWFDTLVKMLPNIVVALLVITTFYFVAKGIKKIVGKMLGRVSHNTSLNKLTSNVVQFIILGMGSFVSLSVLQLDKTVTSILAGAGVIGLALSFAFQETATNFISGIFLVTRRPIKNGDLVECNGYMGNVQKINLRTTEILLFTGQLVLVPNKEVFQNSIINYSTTGRRRIDISCGVSYGDDLEKVKEIAINTIKNLHKLENPDEVTLFFKEFGDSSINFDIRYWWRETEQASYLEAKSAGIIALKKAFDKEGITIPFPIRTMDFGIKGGQHLAQELKIISKKDAMAS